MTDILTSTEERVAAEAARPAGTALVVATSFAGLVVALQTTIVVPAIPRLPEILGQSASSLSWVVTITLLTGAASTPIFSRLADMAGKRRMLLLSMLFVLVGSIVAPLGGLPTMILGRGLQGLGTALVPVAMSIMRDELSPRRAGSAVAFLSATLAIGGSIGIPLGGVLIGALGWQSLFWISAVLSALAVAAILRFVPESPVENPARFDLVGAVLLTISLVALLLGISKGSVWGWTSGLTLGALAVGLVTGLAWGAYELRQRQPLVDLRTAGRRPVLLTDLASLTLGMLMFANLLLTTIQLQGSRQEHGFGTSAAVAGLAMLPSAASMFLVAPFSATLGARRSPRALLMLGAVVTFATYALRGFWSPNAAMVITWTTIASIGIAFGYAALPMLIFEHVELHETAEANGLNALLRAIGTAVASAFVAAVGAGFSVRHGMGVEPSWTALVAIFIAGSLVSLITLGFGAALPRRR